MKEVASAAMLAALALQRNAPDVPGTAFYAAGIAPRNTLRLSYATATPAQIETAITHLGEVFSSTNHLSALRPEPRIRLA